MSFTKGVSYRIPIKLTSPVTLKPYSAGGYDMTLAEINESTTHPLHVLYIPGGGFTNHPLEFHWRTLDGVARTTNVAITVAVYPIVPHHTYIEAYTMIKSLYKEMLAKYGAENLVMMGDSAGGGMVTSFCQYFAKEGIAQPHKIILISPWLDLSLSNPEVKHYQKFDSAPLAAYVCASLAWAGFTEGRPTAEDVQKLKDPQFSPVYGDCSKMPNALILLGDREIMYPDGIKLEKMMKEGGADVKMYIGKGMPHDFALFDLPQAKPAFDRICSYLLSSPSAKKD